MINSNNIGTRISFDNISWIVLQDFTSQKLQELSLRRSSVSSTPAKTTLGCCIMFFSIAIMIIGIGWRFFNDIQVLHLANAIILWSGVGILISVVICSLGYKDTKATKYIEKEAERQNIFDKMENQIKDSSWQDLGQLSILEVSKILDYSGSANGSINPHGIGGSYNGIGLAIMSANISQSISLQGNNRWRFYVNKSDLCPLGYIDFDDIIYSIYLQNNKSNTIYVQNLVIE